MNFTCNECNDTGSRDKLGTYLDCNACGIAAIRRDLSDFVKSLGPTHPEDVALAIHQRALAMAPKQKALAQEPVGMVAKSSFASHKVLVATTQLDDIPLGAKLYLAAPAAANGAPESQPLIGKIMDRFSELPVLWGLNEPGALLRHSDVFRMLVDANREQAATLAAVGPDAALPDFCFEDDTYFMHRLGLLMNTKWPEMRKDGLARKISELANAHIRAALSGAKGN